MARDVFFNGTNLNTITGFEVTHIFANQTPAIELAKSRYGFSSGSAIMQHTYDNKIITIKGVIRGDRDSFDSARAQLEATFYNKLGKLLQYEDEGELLTYTAQLNSSNYGEPQGGFSEIDLIFETTTPFYNKGTTLSAGGTVNGGVDVTIPSVGGTIETLPKFTIDINTWSGTGFDETQTINVTWGVADEGICNVIGIFTAGDQIIIDVANSSVTLNGDPVLYNCNFKGLTAGNTNNYIQAVCADSNITENFTILAEYKKRYI